jgi:SnoaL-like protein
MKPTRDEEQAMTEPHPFRTAVESGDLELLRAVLRDDVVLHSPVLFRPFEGVEMALAVIRAVEQTLSDFTYTDELAEGSTVVLRFKARVDDREIEGIDFLELDADGRVAGLTVFMRPLTAVNRFSAQMAERLGLAPAA